MVDNIDLKPDEVGQMTYEWLRIHQLLDQQHALTSQTEHYRKESSSHFILLEQEKDEMLAWIHEGFQRSPNPPNYRYDPRWLIFCRNGALGYLAQIKTMHTTTFSTTIYVIDRNEMDVSI
ncbi:hypothetical protein [Paenibacillus sp. QZ-Y1]|uniref:hypothetical protein n=1 Tax=Paenibacillus sp. QZ-Y1 TaxID=3414511 RepID=UPI003F78E312